MPNNNAIGARGVGNVIGNVAKKDANVRGLSRGAFRKMNLYRILRKNLIGQIAGNRVEVVEIISRDGGILSSGAGFWPAFYKN
ncbi:MAG TPA: hypothetical protein VHM90_18035 [Phycisphaerae bacterium]|nr:hypothetical protein [Phycisphaerae bacterium]